MYEDNNGTTDADYTQVMNWNNFIGSGTFCLKLCYNNVTSPDYCQNKFDLIGCDYNMPSANVDGEFLKCDGDLQDEVGTYTGSNGKTTVWSQPASLADDYSMPYTPTIPATSNCRTYSSEELFGSSAAATSAAATAVSASATTASATTSATVSSAQSSATSSVIASTASASTLSGTTAIPTASASASASGTTAPVSSASASDSAATTATEVASSATASAAASSSPTSDAMRLVVGSTLVGAAVLSTLVLLI